MQSVITYRFESDENPDIEAIRLTVRTVTMAQIGQHARMYAEAVEQWRVETNNPTDEQRAARRKEVIPNGEEKETDKDAAQEVLDAAKEPTPEEKILYNQYTRWPAVFVATADKVLVLKRSKKPREMDEDAPDTWPWEVSSKAAMGWDKPAGILNLPWDFFADWERQAHAVNSGVFSPSNNGSATKKKGMGLISVI